jgi:serine/threonine protein kinase
MALLSEPPDHLQPPQFSGPTISERPERRREPSRAEMASKLEPGTRLGRYKIVRHVGAGGMGTVYEAVHSEIGRTVAIKVLSAALAADERARARFSREAAAASRLHHRHVVSVTDYGSEGGLPFIVMELLRGEDLGNHIDRFPRGMSVTDAVDMMVAVAIGVFAAHDAGVIHRDLKPRNIFLARTELREVEPKVLDFGISRIDDDFSPRAALTDSETVVGTVPYLSPEQIRGGAADARSDQYSLGVVLYEALTGHCPHEGDTRFALMTNIVEGKFFAPSERRPNLDPGVEQIVLRAMALRPDERFASVFEFARALLPFASERKRVVWASFFSRDPKDLSYAEPVRSPTRPMEVSPPESPRVETWFKSSAEFGPETAAADSTQKVVRWPRRLLVASLVAAGAVVVAKIRPWQRLSRADQISQADTPSKSSLEVPPTVSKVEARLRSEPVTIQIVGAPTGVRATVDGVPSDLPMRLPRDGRSRQIEFAAPGFQTESVTIVPIEDRTLEIRLLRVSGGDEERLGGRKERSRPSGRTTRPKVGAKSSGRAEPRPITDI